jgi:23S rRNA pseudouridine1911/1915/1917 synthase
METLNLTVPEELAGSRLDKALATLCDDLSRARLQALIDQGAVLVNGKTPISSFKVKGGEDVVLTIPDPVPDTPEAQDIPLEIIYEDDDLLVLNKQAGLVVHPGAGNPDDTLVNALLHHCGDTLSGIGGVKRPGIVHRLDKDTTGLMLVAKNDHAHHHLSEQLQLREVKRTYMAYTVGQPLPITGQVNQPLDRHRTNRLKIAVMRGGREARTNYRLMEKYGAKFGMVLCDLETGRTHQIRVHMAHIDCPLIGDALYGPQKTALEAALRKAENQDEAALALIRTFPRQALHACAIRFIHPVTEEEMEFEAEPPQDLVNLAAALETLFPS